MLAQVLRVFSIVPDVDLDLMQSDQSLGSFSSRALTALDAYLNDARPEFVIVQGDTTTVFCAALAAFYHRVPVGHVEAGLRSGDLYSPWPEEANRVLVSRLASLHFAPTEGNKANLVREGVRADRIVVTGNTVIDALAIARRRIRSSRINVDGLPRGILESSQKIVLVTGHRRENFGGPLRSICEAIRILSERFKDVVFIYPVHLNPNVRRLVYRMLGGLENVFLLEPVDYLGFVALMDRAALILSDSGGIQEEATSLGRPVLVMRDSTERPEALEAGTARLVGTDKSAIVENAAWLLTNEEGRLSMSRACSAFGDGRAAAKIVDSCIQFLREYHG